MLLFKDGHCTTVEGTAGDILSAAPQGTYTRFRTVQRTQILYLDQHVARLRKSLLGMLDDHYVKVHHLSIPGMDRRRQEAEEKLTESFLTRYMIEVATCILKQIPTGDARVDVHISAYESGFPMFALGASVPETDETKDTVILEKGERGTPTIKDTQWVRERKPLEGLVKGNIEEVILMDDDGYLYEGISSNFFVLVRRYDGALVLQTAEDKYVLQGTVRSLALSIANSLNITVEMSRPRIADINNWVGVFITSTTRGIKPISHVSLNGAIYDFSTDESLSFKQAMEQSELNYGSLIKNK